ncbi:endonuclease/exonuclease/phosphatase family protein [Stieleria varia]|uniref:endonuclease/exonuclease/phosphatase family protein n=1 Tax=Stieleria varia TaxID=2528005 RepID=UPI001E450D9B|nr:endonuclease/exonuclease/phosphatase family protein [Stieleria varia]
MSNSTERNETVSSHTAPNGTSVRVATFNVSLYGKKSGEILTRLSDQDDLQAKRIASIVQTVRPDVLLINEIDYAPDGRVAKLLNKNYFAVAQENLQSDGSSEPQETSSLQPMDYPYVVSLPSNTGIDSGLDLNSDGETGTPNDAWGFGVYPGQYAMTLLSRYPIDVKAIRTFQEFLWKDLPGALRPTDPKTGQPYYDDATWAKLRLSSKNHADIPVIVSGVTLHALVSHPTPPVFDGPEDRNGCRNHDEILFWEHYVDGDSTAGAKSWMVDDQGIVGGLKAGEAFVVMGDLNSDPVDGDGRQDAIAKLLARSSDAPAPSSRGGELASVDSKSAQDGNPANDTAMFGRNGNMRVDFVLPGKTPNVSIKSSGVFWPAESDPRSQWLRATDHRLVWVDLILNGTER